MNCTTCSQVYRILTTDEETARSACRCDLNKACSQGLKRCGVPVVVLADPYDLSFVLTYWCEKHVPEEWISLVAPAVEKPTVRTKPVKATERKGCTNSGCGNPPDMRVLYDADTHSDWCSQCYPAIQSVLKEVNFPHEVRRLR